MGNEGSETPDSTGEVGEGEPVPTQRREAGVREIEPLGGNMAGTQEPEGMSTKVQRIAELARAYPARAFVSLAHVMDRAWLYEAYRRTRKDGAVGIDGQTAAMYEADLDANLADLLERLKSGRYRAPAVRRVQIPKADGRKRPIGIPTLEDKVAQRAVVMVLEAIYEQDFLACSYGFRPGRSPQQALDALWSHLKAMRGGWVVEIDIQSFFDELDKGALREMLDERVRDGVIRKLIDKWLTAGVVENGQVLRPEKGTPQGGVISPLLANIYLHVVLDRWFSQEVKPRLQGRGELIRYADDAVMVFANERDARRVMAVLPKRMTRFGLRLHPEKTKLLSFRPRPPQTGGGEGGRSFDFLGFTHFWALNRHGYWVVKQKTASGRLQRSLDAIKAYCRRYRHRPVWEQHRALSLMLRGHYGYFGRAGNHAALARLHTHTRLIWVKWLGRRSQRSRLSWTKAGAILSRFPLPRPRTAWSGGVT